MLEEKLVSNNKISKEDIIDFVRNTSAKFNLKINEISFNNNNFEASFDFDNNNFNLNYEMIEKKYKNIFKFNVEVIITIFHELTHAVQKIQVFDNETYKKFPSYYVMLVSNYFEIVNNNEFYCINHDDFAIEYNANVCSYLLTIDLLKKHNLDYSNIKNKLDDYINDRFCIETNINDKLIQQISNLNISEEILFKFRYALHNYGKEENLTDQEYEIYGYKK